MSETLEEYMKQEGEEDEFMVKAEMIIGFGKDIRIKGKFVGILDNGIFIAERQKSKLFRIHSGWGISKALLQELVQTNTKKIIFRIKNENKLEYILETTPESWIRKGIEYFNPTLKEEQLILSESNFDRKIISNLRVV